MQSRRVRYAIHCLAVVTVAVGLFAILGDRSSTRARVEDIPRAPRELAAASSGSVTILAVSQDGKFLAGGGTDGTVTLWETAGWERQPVLPQQSYDVVALQFSSDGRKLLVGDSSGRIAVIDVATAKVVREIQRVSRLGKYLVARSAFSDDGSLAAVAENSKSEGEMRRLVRVYSTQSGEEIRRIAISPTSQISLLGFDPHGGRLFVGPHFAPIVGYELSNGASSISLDMVRVGSSAIQFSKTTGDIVTYNGGRLVVRCDGRTGARNGYLDFGTHKKVYGIALHHTGRLVATTDSDGRLLLWDVDRNIMVRQLDASTGGIFDVEFVQGTNQLVSTTGSSRLRVHDVSPDLASLR